MFNNDFGAEHGYETDASADRLPELSEQDLLAVAGATMADTHVHMSCCGDCHSQHRC